MSAQGAPSAAAEVMVDDNPFSAEEQAQFDAMQQGIEADVPAEEPIVVEGEQPVDPALVAGEGDDDDEPEAGQQAGQPQPGQPQLGPDGKPIPRRVNYNKFARMEERAKKAEGELQTVKELFTRTDERLKLLNDALTAGQRKEVKDQREEDPEPDPEKDIFGWVQWARRDRGRMMEQLQGHNQRTQATEQESAVATAYTEDARIFGQNEPQFAPAYNYLMQSRAVELAQYFFGKDLGDGDQLTAQEVTRIKAAISAEERELVTEALRNRQSPAQRIFKLARARGFRPQQPGSGGQRQPQPGQGQPQPQPGGQPTAAAPATPSVAAEIASIQRGTRTPSLSSGGGSPVTPLTAEKLASMPQADFERMLERMTETQQRALFGA